MKPAAEISGTTGGAVSAGVPSDHYKLWIPEARIADEPGSSDAMFLDAGLAAARKAAGYTLIAFAAPIVGASAVVAAWPSVPLVAWSSRELTIVGVDVAHELRG